jgi:hypothetical protein
MTVYLEGKTPLSAMFFLQGGNFMSRDIQYIGMDGTRKRSCSRC